MKRMRGTRGLWLVLGLVAGAGWLSACAAPDPRSGETAAAAATATSSATSTAPASAPATDALPTTTTQLVPPQPPPARAAAEFKTDFSRASVSFEDILSGGPPKDGIPAIDAPQFVDVAEADAWLKPNEPVIRVQIGPDARAYPLQILMWHELVNDTVGGVPVVVSFCPLCNTAIAFERMVGGRVLDFGTTGRLRYSNLIMYDRQTESWWQQGPGTAIVGELTGAQLKFVPAAVVSWADFKSVHPDGRVLSRDTGHTRPYGRNPYEGYDDVNRPPFLYQGPAISGTLPAVARVLGIELGGEAVAYPFEVLQQARVVSDSVGGTPIVVFWAPGTASALDAAAVPDGRDVGAANAFERRLDGRLLEFSFDGERIVDAETGSAWDLFGRAVSGPLEGEALTPVVAVNHFWFSWSVFKPGTRVHGL